MHPEILSSAAAVTRLGCARQWLREIGPSGQVLVVAPTLEAAAELTRAAVSEASFGWQRLTSGRLWATLAAGELVRRGLVVLGPLALEAVCARLLFTLGQAKALGSLQHAAEQPGLARALARTLLELRLAGATDAQVEAERPDLGRLLAAYERELAQGGFADRAEILRVAAACLRDPQAYHPLPLREVVLVDPELRSTLDADALCALSGRGRVRVVLPEADSRALQLASQALGCAPVSLDADAPRSSLQRVQRLTFAETTPLPAELDPSVQILSAPGEGRECVELVRRLRAEAEQGVPFDRMAVLLRAPGQYRALMEEALERADIPAWFARGSVRPDPSGRAFLALLACAADRLPARRFAEYLSLGEVPDPTGLGAPPPAREGWMPAEEELQPAALAPDGEEAPQAPEPPAPDDPDAAPVSAGTLRAPWRWEKLLLDAAVIGGHQRWARRLEGLRVEVEAQRAALAEKGEQSQRVERQLADLSALRNFALPLVAELHAWPSQASWSEWLTRLTALATRALRRPDRVLALLAELTPMGPIGPVTLAEVRHVLSRRLAELTEPPPPRRAGRVFVGPIDAARGLSFGVVLVPGLAERIFPQRLGQDPLLPDLARVRLQGQGLRLDAERERVESERLALRVALGAAEARAHLSWPRQDSQGGRPRVPSFYGLELLRAAEGRLPSFTELMQRAQQASGARLGWPAPASPHAAIDEAEHDLALLDAALRRPGSDALGAMHYLLEVNPHLARALRTRWARWDVRKWRSADGLVDLGATGRAALAKHLPAARAYSPTALQHFAACPYRFFLQAVLKLEPREEPEAIDELDPLSRGLVLHETQYRLLQRLRAEGRLPLFAPDPALRQAHVVRAWAELDEVLSAVARGWEEKLAPAIPRVWEDGIQSIRADLRHTLWLLGEQSDWSPDGFEISFGLRFEQRLDRDPRSTEAPVRLDEGLVLRGSIDLVEKGAGGRLRATDYKTGKVRAEHGMSVGGGAVLQPALYALALEKLFPSHKVAGARLWYCTFVGQFVEVEVPLDAQTRSAVSVVVATVSAALQSGFLPRAPGEGACEHCDFAAVCGPGAERLARRKPARPLQALHELRRLP